VVEIFDHPEGEVVEKIKKKKKDKSRHKSRHREREEKPEEQPIIIPPQNTGMLNMSKLRSRDPLETLRQIRAQAHINL
jgi:hypothetical protein